MSTIAISINVDVVGALAADTVADNVYLVDNNRVNGSQDEGTGVLKTRVSKGDRLLWTAVSIEPEAYASLAGIEIDSRYCEPRKQTYPGSNVVYWEAEVKTDLDAVPYRFVLELGNPPREYWTVATPSLIGNAGGSSPRASRPAGGTEA